MSTTNHHLYEHLIQTNQNGGAWAHPIYSRRRRGGGFKNILAKIKTISKHPLNTGRRYLATMVKNHGKGIAQSAISGVLGKKSLKNIVKDAVIHNKGSVWKDTKKFFLNEMAKAKTSKKPQKGGKRKLIKKRTTKGKRRTTTKKQRGGHLKNKKLGITNASNHTRASRVMIPIFK